MHSLLATALLFSVVLPGFGAFASEPAPGQLQSNLQSLFAKESAAVIFSFRPADDRSALPSAKRYALIQTDENGQEIHRLGPLLDDGILGDQKRQDGVYGRKFNVSQKRGGSRYYRVVESVSGGEKAVSTTLRLEVVAHPPIQVLLKQIWERIRSIGGDKGDKADAG